MSESPYRKQVHVLLCPRCGDVLAEVFRGVSSCIRCEGLWIPQPAIDRAFGDPLWPGGPGVWWRRELNCPVCASEGRLEVMTPILDGNVVVDRCRGHGLWLDAGELGRILGTDDSGIAELYLRLFDTEMPEELLRKLTGDEIAHRRHEAAAMRTLVEKMLAEHRDQQDVAQQRHDEWQQECDYAREAVQRHEAQLIRAREHLKQQERELAKARALLRSLEANGPGAE